MAEILLKPLWFVENISLLVILVCDFIKRKKLEKKIRTRICPKCGISIVDFRSLDVMYCPCCGANLREEEHGKQS